MHSPHHAHATKRFHRVSKIVPANPVEHGHSLQGKLTASLQHYTYATVTALANDDKTYCTSMTKLHIEEKQVDITNHKVGDFIQKELSCTTWKRKGKIGIRVCNARLVKTG